MMLRHLRRESRAAAPTPRYPPPPPPRARRHAYPLLLPRVQVDKGAIKFVLSGANVMCRGLTSAGGALDTDLPVGASVAVYAEGKEHALAIGALTMSTADIKALNKGIAVEVFHFLGDDLWRAKDGW